MKKLLYILTLLSIFAFNLSGQGLGDAALAKVSSQDKFSRNAVGELKRLPVGVHMYRADVYMANRQFPTAREHWQMVLNNYPNATVTPKALFGMGRSNMWERNYATAIEWFDKLTKDHVRSFHGREGLAYKGACYVRLGKNLDAARVYEQYTVMFPYGKRIESSYLNILDAYREAAKYDLANIWVNKTRARFRGKKAEINALHAQLRMEVFRKNWGSVISVANELIRLNRFNKSMAYEYEVQFLKAYAYENLENKARAIIEYNKIPANATSYFGGLATSRIELLGGNAWARTSKMMSQSRRMSRSFPIRYRSALIRYSKSKGLDPRFVLSIMKQESNFKPRAKSPAAARGLLQLTFDTALKYNQKASFNNIKATDLYRPNVNIAIGSVYLAELKSEFSGLYEAIAASYNAGEDNASRWLVRSDPQDAAIFASEVGFSETKKYVFKVMGNYQVYKALYTENLIRK